MDEFNKRAFSSFDKTVEPLIKLTLLSLVIQFHSPVESMPKLMSLLANSRDMCKANFIAIKCQYLFRIRQHSWRRDISVKIDSTNEFAITQNESNPKSKIMI